VFITTTPTFVFPVFFTIWATSGACCGKLMDRPK
jgi:hypothetical protein